MPVGKKVAFPCPACKTRIRIDLRSTPNQKEIPNDSGKAQPKKPATKKPGTERQPSGMALKYGILRALEDLPAMPEIVLKAQEIMANPDSSLKFLASIVELEPAISTTILKIANSSYYGLQGKVSSIQHAISLLGYNTLAELITMAGVSNILEKTLKGYDLSSEDLWRHSMAVALGSKIIANRKDPDLENVAFSNGLIHDTGKLILDQHVYERRELIKEFMQDGRQTFLEAEKQILGFDHAEIASEFCSKWRIPEDQVLAIRFHHHPSLSEGNQLSYILHVADALAMMGGMGTGSDYMLYGIEHGALEFLGLKEEEATSIMDEVMESVEKIVEEIGKPLAASEHPRHSLRQ